MLNTDEADYILKMIIVTLFTIIANIVAAIIVYASALPPICSSILSMFLGCGVDALVIGLHWALIVKNEFPTLDTESPLYAKCVALFVIDLAVPLLLLLFNLYGVFLSYTQVFDHFYL